MNFEHIKSALNDRLNEMGVRGLPEVEVAVLDSGIDATHPDLAGRVIAAYHVEGTGDDADIVEASPLENNDVFGHGTAVASIIARLAPHARFVDFRVLGPDNRGSGDDLVVGLRSAVRRKSRLVNMSLAATAKYANRLLVYCEQAYHQNQIIVASKLNMPLTDNGFPAEFSCCISVDNDAFESPFAFRYLPESVIEYAALGDQVIVAAAGGGYTTKCGTSYAAPTVTGLCALLVGAYPGLRPFEVKTLLKVHALEDA